MNKKFLIGILVTSIVATVQAEVYCPKGPAVCRKADNGIISCTVVGDNNIWTFFRATNISNPNTDYVFPFSLATSQLIGPADTKSTCTYTNLNNPNQGAVFRSSYPLIHSTPGLNGWQPFGPEYICETSLSGICPFKSIS